MIYSDTICTDTMRLGILSIKSNTKKGGGSSKSTIYQPKPALTLFNLFFKN